MAENVGDINLNINVNVRGAAGLQSIQTGLANIQAQGAKVAKAVGGVTTSMRNQSKAAETLKSRLDAAETKYDAIFRASYRLQNVGYGLINVSKIMFGVLRDLTQQWGTFEFTVNRAAGALQIFNNAGSTTNPIYEALIENVYKLTKELGIFPANDVAKATYYWASTTGQQVKSLTDLKITMQAINPLMKIAALTETSYESAIKGVYSILVQYHKGLEQTGDVTAKLHLVTQRTALEFGDLINAFKFVGPTAGALGVSFEEVAQTLGAIGDAGIRGTMAGRALRQMFIQTARPTAKAREMLDNVFRSTKSLGKGFEELIFPQGQFVGITKMANYLAIALKNATARDRQFFLSSITTANELPVLTVLVENQIRALNGASDAYDSNKASVTDAAKAQEAFRKSWDLLANSWKGIVGKLRAGAEVIKLRVGRNIAESLKPAVAQMTAMLEKIERWVKRNPELVATIGRMAAGLGALTAAAGGIFVLAGALLGLSAAVGVIVDGFAPLFAIGSATLGALVALGEAVINNWMRIQRVIVPAVNRLMAALTGGRGGIEALKDEFGKFHKIVKDVANFIVRTAIKAFEHLLNIMTDIANSPLRPVIEAFGQAIVAAFGIRSVGALLGFGKAANLVFKALGALAILFRSGAITTAIGVVFLPLMTRVSVALAIVRAGAIGTAIQLKLMGGASLFSVKGIRALTTALTTMSKTSVLIIITAFVLALDLLNEMLPKTGANLDDVTQSYKDFLFEVGDGAKTLDAQISSATDGLGGYTDKIIALQDALNAVPVRSRRLDVNQHRKELEDEINRLTLLQEEMKAKYAQSFRDLAYDTERGLGEVLGIFEKYGPKLFGELTNDKSIKSAQMFTKEYFAAIGEEGILSAKEAVTIWNKLIADGVDMKGVSASQFLKNIVSKDELQRAANDITAALQLTDVGKAMREHSFEAARNILIGLKAGADTYSDDVNAEVDRLLSGLPTGFTKVMEEVDALATKAPGEILSALVSGFESLGDVQKKIEAALKRGPITKEKIVKALLGDISGKETSGALASKFNELQLLGLTAIDNAHTQFIAAVAAYDRTGNTTELAKEIQKQFGPEKFKQIFFGTYKGSDWKNLTDEQRTGIQEMVDWAATELSLVKPSATVIKGVTATLTGKAAQLFRAEFGNLPVTPAATTGADPISELVKTMVDPWEKSGKPFIDQVGQYFTKTFNDVSTWFDSHPDPLGTLAKNMNLSLVGDKGVYATTDAAANYIKNHLSGNSPPPEGPLSTIDKGGLAMMMAWVGGLLAATPAVIATATLMAARVAVAMSPPSFSLLHGGFNVMKSWVDGFILYWILQGRKRVIAVQTDIKKLHEGHSPPKIGPLKNIDKGGYNIGKAWADGMMRGTGLAVGNAMATAAQVRTALAIDGEGSRASLAFSANTERTIRVEIDVTSSDGSVDGLTVQQLKSAITSDDLVRSLQHMASAKG